MRSAQRSRDKPRKISQDSDSPGLGYREHSFGKSLGRNFPPGTLHCGSTLSAGHPRRCLGSGVARRFAPAQFARVEQIPSAKLVSRASSRMAIPALSIAALLLAAMAGVIAFLRGGRNGRRAETLAFCGLAAL